MLASIAAFLPVVLPIISWFMRKAGASEEQMKVFEESVKAIQTRRASAAKPSDDEKAALEELAKKLSEPKV